MLKGNRARRAALELGLGLGLLASILAVPGVVTAEPEDDRRDFRSRAERPERGARGNGAPGHFIERHGDELGLSDEVRERIQEISDESRRRADLLHEEIRVEQVAMRELLTEASPDESAVLAQSERVETLRSQQRTNRLEAMLGIRKLLTAEQREQLAEMRGEARPGGRRGFDDARGFAAREGRDGDGRAGKRRGGARRGCRDDLATLCPAAETGRDRLRCLDREWERLSEGCRASFEGRGRRGGGPAGAGGDASADDVVEERSPL